MALLEVYSPKLGLAGAIVLLIWLGYKLYCQAYGTDVPFVNGIPEVPESVPFYGHLNAMGKDHASKLQEWAEKHNWPVFQVKFGSRRFLILNTFQSAQHFISKNAAATIDRPLFYTFHKVLSATQGSTIGSSPWNESCKRRRIAVGAIMTRPAIQKSAPLLDLEISAAIKDLWQDSVEASMEGLSTIEIDPRIYFQRMALNITLMMCYSTRIATVKDLMLHELLYLANSISTFRSTNNNIQDWVGLYRYLPKNERTKLAEANKNKRDIILAKLLDKVETAMKAGMPVSCISQGLLQEQGSSKLTRAEIRSINVSLVSGGFETLSTTSSAGMGYLASSQGQCIQQRAYEAIVKVYSSPEEAWQKCLFEENVPYVLALVREMLRYFAAIQLLPPRQSLHAFEYQGVKIPPGIGIFINAQAINHDKSAYGPDADQFRPERWLDENSHFNVGLPYHYSFGAGSRMCTAVALSNRILYALFLRLILHFEFVASENFPPITDYVDIDEDRTGQAVRVKPFKILLKMRGVSKVLEDSLKRSAEFCKEVPIV